MRRRTTVVAGTVEHHATELVSYWHRHDLHEIEYAVTGVAEIRTPTTHYLLPPCYAAWVPAGVEHSPLLKDVTTIAVFFDPAVFDFPHERAAIIPVPPVLREMMRYATRWPVGRADNDDDLEATAFFQALAGVVRRQLAHEAPLSLPVSDDPVVKDVMAYTAAHLADARAAAVCRAVGVSERVLRRRFAAVLGQTWQEHLRQARLFRAMALLSSPTASVSEIAAAVGFGSASALARAFRTWTGESPSAYRDRLTTADSDRGGPNRTLDDRKPPDRDLADGAGPRRAGRERSSSPAELGTSWPPRSPPAVRPAPGPGS